MTKKADTWMPWYVADYLADTAHLNTEQHGAYCLMLMASWKRGGALPRDDGQMASICRLVPAKWKAYRSVLLEFFEDTGEVFMHKRVTLEHQKAQAINNKKSISGAEGAAKRWGNVPKNGSGFMADAMADAMAHPLANALQTDAPAYVFLPSPLQTPSELPLDPNGSLPTALPLTEKIPACPQIALIDLFGSTLVELPQPKPELWVNGKNAAAMASRWKWLLTAKRRSGQRYATNHAEAMDWFGRFFTHVSESDFLMGRNDAAFKCSLGWLVKAENFEKVVQGNYKNQGSA